MYGRNRLAVMALFAVLGSLVAALVPTEGLSQPTPDALRERVRAAITKGQKFLLAQHQKGMWRHTGFAPPTVGNLNQSDIGATALVGLALLETGVPATDPAITAAVRTVVDAAPYLTLTYALSTSIWFLDRVDGNQHAVVIRGLANSLLRGQLAENGGWGYECPSRTQLSDNSNTQFACLALFIARRHRVAAEPALRLMEQRFRRSQDPETGGWSYQFEMPQRVTGSMTCAGLLALSMGMYVAKSREVRFDARGPGAVQTKPGGAAPMPDIDLSPLLRDPAVLRARDFIRSELLSANTKTGHLTYFLWSIERTCLVYGWQRLGDTDWYGHGAELLLRLQQPDGSWDIDAQHGPPIDTAFAILFLGRSNLVPELAVFRGGDPRRAAQATRPDGGAATPQSNEPVHRLSIKQIARELPTSTEPRTSELIARLVDSPSDAAVAAFLEVINHPNTKPTVKGKARAGLARRLAVGKTADLVVQLQSRDRELRLAACTAAIVRQADKGETRPLIPKLIATLGDADAAVAQAALAALRAITGEDFGPHPAGWQRWWDRGGQ
jgi:hypothetical protein